MARSQQLVMTNNGVAIDLLATSREAEKKVDRDEKGTPIHACGKAGDRECPCWICTRDNCAACAID